MITRALERERNRALNLEEYRSGATRLSSLPQYLIVELTQGCNLACPMCRPEIISASSRLMSHDTFDVVASLFGAAWMIDLRGWGESLLLPDISERIRRAAGSGALVRFVTNLAFRRPDVIEEIVTSGCYVSVSVDSVTADMFRHLRGGANLELVKQNLATLTDGNIRRHGNAERISLNTTVQAPALLELEHIVDFAAEVRVPEVRLFSVTADCSSPLSLSGRADAVDEALKRAATRATERGVRLTVGTRLGSMAGPVDNPPCMHPWSYAYFSWEGAVGFCDHLIGPDGEPYLVGSLKDRSFEEIWNGPEWTALRAEHVGERRQSAPFFHECSWCYANRFVDFEHVFDPDAENRRVFLARPITNG